MSKFAVGEICFVGGIKDDDADANGPDATNLNGATVVVLDVKSPHMYLVRLTDAFTGRWPQSTFHLTDEHLHLEALEGTQLTMGEVDA